MTPSWSAPPTQGWLHGAVAILATSSRAHVGQVAKLTAADAAASDNFGRSVAIDGSTVVVGANGDDSYARLAFVFRPTGGATYAQVAKLTASDAASYDEFGYSVAIDGDTIVVGPTKTYAARRPDR